MRIRKRQVPLPLSSLSPIPLSDPLFLDSTGYGRETTAAEFGNAYASEVLRDITGEKRNDSRAPDIPRNAPETSSSLVVSASPSENEAVIRWLEEDKASLLPRDHEERGTTGGKKRGREGAVGISGMNIEGSRCSRVNGRGWRCGQQTLVGYSLCEHHLGKGRLRSVSTSVRCVVSASKKGSEKPWQVQQPAGTDDASLLVSSAEEIKRFVDNNKEEDDNDEDDDENVDLAEVVRKKRARSMSSLLGQGPEYADDLSVAAAGDTCLPNNKGLGSVRRSITCTVLINSSPFN